MQSLRPWSVSVAVLAAALCVSVAESGGGPAKPPGGAPAGPAATGTGWISGTVLTDDGKPFVGAKIEVVREKAPKGRWSATTDAKGNFGVRGVPPGPATVLIRAKGFIADERQVTVPATGVVGCDAKLSPGVRFAGYVHDVRDKPVGGVQILAFRQRDDRSGGFSFSYFGSGGSGESKDDGTFEVDGLAPGDTYTIRLVHPHFMPVDLPGLSAAAGGGHDHLDAILEDAGWVSGTVVDKAGRPIRGVRVSGPKNPYAAQSNFMGFMFISMMLGDDQRNVSDAQGHFLVGCLDAVETRLSADGPDHFPNSVLVTPTLGEETKGVTLTMEVAAATVEGQVVDGDGKPVPSAEVAAYGEDGRAAEANADAQGRFRLTRVKSKAPVTLTASADGYADGRTEAVPLESKGAKVEMKRLGRLVLEVLGADGKRIERVVVRVLTESDRAGRGTSSHDQSKGPIEMFLPLGSIEVMVRAKGYAEKKVGAYEVTPGQKVDAGKVTLEKAEGKDAEPDEPDDGD